MFDRISGPTLARVPSCRTFRRNWCDLRRRRSEEESFGGWRLEPRPRRHPTFETAVPTLVKNPRSKTSPKAAGATAGRAGRDPVAARADRRTWGRFVAAAGRIRLGGRPKAW